MAHDIDLLIGRMPINIDKVKEFGLAVAFENNFAIVFLDNSHLWHWSQKLNLKDFSENENLNLGGELVHFFAKEIGLDEYIIAYLCFDFYGVLYKNSVVIDEGEIDSVLKKLGVEHTSHRSAFHQLNLDDYRTAEIYYWKGDLDWVKYSKNKNIIAGKIDE